MILILIDKIDEIKSRYLYNTMKLKQMHSTCNANKEIDYNLI